MGHAVTSDETSLQASAPQVIPGSRIQEALAEMMSSSPFRSSKQSQNLLRYIVDKSLSGHAELLKERVIGIEVFGRRPDYDTNADPIVRARVAELRKRLAVYYQTEHDKAVRISVPPGSFKAVFEWIPRPHMQLQQTNLVNSAPTPLFEEPTKTPELTPPAPPMFWGLTWWLAAVACVALLVFALAQYPSHERRSFNQFWSPVLDNSDPVLISIGSNPAYALSAPYIEAYYRQHPESQNRGMDPYMPLAPDVKLDGRDLVLVNGTLVALSDVAATTKILSLMERRKKHFDFRLGNDLTYGDLREDPGILIGAYNNPWTLSMIANQRYVFSTRADILDRSTPQRHWTPKADSTDDYAIVSRVLNSKTGKTILIAAGIAGAGTRAATDFITEPKAIAALANVLPEGWQKRNVEVVLHASVTNGVPSAPEVVATYTW